MTVHCHLGLTMSHDMSCAEHIRILDSKTSQQIGILNYFKYRLSRDVLLHVHLYKSSVLPVFDYCDQIYDNCTAFQRNSLERVHLAGARVCTGALKFTNTNVLLQDELGWKKLETRRWHHKIFCFYKIASGMAPANLTRFLPMRSMDNPSYTGRHPLSFRSFKFRTRKFKNSFFPSGTTALNSLAHTISSSPNLLAFKSALNKVYLVLQPPSFFGIGRRRLSIVHTRLRLKHNQLNHHLYRLGIKDSPPGPAGIQ